MPTRTTQRGLASVGVMIMGVMLAFPSHVLAQNFDHQLPESRKMPSPAQNGYQVETLSPPPIEASPDSTSEHQEISESGEQSPATLKIVTRIDNDPSLEESHEMASEREVQQLEETVIRDTYLDPFADDTHAESIQDPWEPINAQVFAFNMHVDRYVLKPVATGYAWVVPDPLERAIGRAIDNLRVVPRTVNDVLQWKWKEAGVEVSRFVINSTVGMAGLFDVAGDYLDLEAVPPEDFGQTLAKYGVQAGPYLVLPLLPPTTVRDGIGTVGDLFLDPLSYVLPFIPQVSLRVTEIVNDRSQNLDFYQGVELATLDMYGAVREAYAQKRSRDIWE